METIDKELEIPVYSEVCSYCVHLKDLGKKRKCKAFPKGIPMDIWMGENEHTEKHPAQKNDIVFKILRA